MLTRQQITVAADRLYQAEKEHEQIKALTMSFNMDMDDAYAIQKAWIDRRLKDGEKIIGYKIGLTSRTMQVAMNINTPDYGVLTDAMLFPNKSKLNAADYLDPRIESEFCVCHEEATFWRKCFY